MRGTRKSARFLDHYQLAYNTFVSPRTQFVCADCRRALQKDIRALSQRRHASSRIRRVALDGHDSSPDRMVNRFQQYHGSSKHAVGIEHHTSPKSDEAFFPRGNQNEPTLSIRQQLKQWRKDNDATKAAQNMDSEMAKSLAIASSQIQIPGPNSIGPQEELDDSTGEGKPGNDFDPLGDYQNDWAGSYSPMNSGDLADISLPGSSGSSGSPAIFVRLIDAHAQFITLKGYWYVAVKYLMTSGKIESYASSDELAPVMPYLPDTALLNTEMGSLPIPITKLGSIPIDVVGPIVKRLAQLELDISAFQHKHALAFDTLYETLADDEDLVEWQMDDVVPLVFGFANNELSAAGRLAIDRFAAHTEHGMVASRTAVKTVGYVVQSRQGMRRQKQVIEWARIYQETAARAALGKDVKEELRKNPLSGFINKAHRLILKSRKIRSPTTIGQLGPSAESGNGGAVQPVDPEETLTKNDKLIVQFIVETSQITPPLVLHEAQAICALIYRAIGAYPNLRLGGKVARLLCQELGVFSPWHNRKKHMLQLRLPGIGILPYQNRLLAAAEESCQNLGEFQLSDEHARKNWGSMPVYCIDSQETVEVDDGISIERDVNAPDSAWIHVHIANPAAYISPDHPIAALAKDVVSSMYTPTRKYSMMPANFAENVSSLAADRPVMTVSTLVQADGSIARIEMSLGIVHNVIRLTHSAVDGALGAETYEQATMVVGGERPAHEEPEEISRAIKQALPDLVEIRQFLYRRYEKRRKDWPAEERMARKTEDLRTTAWTNLVEEALPYSPDKITHWKGDPIIVVSGDRSPRTCDHFDSQPLVDHVMLLAGESAAKWCVDRKIPIFFHVATPHPLFPISKLNQLAESDYRQEPKGRISATAKPHWHLTMRQYTKVTSPIRRYPDLVNQWQIQSYLRGISSASEDPRNASLLDPLSNLPFTLQELENLATSLGNRLALLKQVGTAHEVHFINQAFFRAFHFKEAELPEVWDFRIIGTDVRNQSDIESTCIFGCLVPFRVRAELLVSEERWEKDAGRNQYLPVKIQVVDIEQDKIFVKAVGPPSATLITTQPIHIQSSKKSVSANMYGPEQQQS